MSSDDEKYVKEIFAFFYPGMGLPDSITPAAGDLAAQMLKETIEGSKAMDFVPRPPAGPPGLAWLLLQAVQIFWRSHRPRLYETVRVQVARAHRSEYEMAKAGIL
jgi:hypothetical protein